MSSKMVDKKLAENGIGARPFFHPMHLQPCILQKRFKKEEFNQSEMLAEYGFCLPSGLTLTEEQILRICNFLNKHGTS